MDTIQRADLEKAKMVTWEMAGVRFVIWLVVRVSVRLVISLSSIVDK